MKPRQFTHGATTYALASPWCRLAAQTIDLIVASLIVAICAVPLLLISPALGALLAPLAYAYLLFADAIWNGQSLDHPEDYHWKICDVVTLLHAVDPKFLNELLIQKNIALEQYLVKKSVN
ncbi:hypothetical protein [Pseudomonas viridiflava]|uniref:hypothetical protein n=1 Tax=Pseudomonas viridiflava TaxID=33069 RepID=UPI000F04C859|nr:hypothetical protein [Pseudomonas viridiflava]